MYAIIYTGETKEISTPEGTNVILQAGMLLGYTDFPDDPAWQDKPYEFIEVESVDKEPLAWKYENGQWQEVV
uniref:Uncharacterized protein n=1 Tax=uncultured Aquificia bacterium TaxID=453415 RepID=H5SBV6_9BACT|nr:hypothetical protein HGMM_F07F09C17 [uncultured Aquificae bacterium]